MRDAIVLADMGLNLVLLGGMIRIANVENRHSGTGNLQQAGDGQTIAAVIAAAGDNDNMA